MKFAIALLASIASAVHIQTTTQGNVVGQPALLLHQNGYCNDKGGAPAVWRIAMTTGHTVDSCNELCLNTQGCKRFLFGKKGGRKGRCDLVKTEDCELIDKYFDFDYYQITQHDQVRKRTSHISALNPNGCNSQIHPQGYLGQRKFGTQAECTEACWQTNGCIAFNMHRGSHCHLYAKDYPCGPNPQQDKYYMDFGDAAPPPPLVAQTPPVITAPASPDCTVLPFAWQIVSYLARINYEESAKIIRDDIQDVKDAGVRMATPSEILAIQANSTATGGKLTGSYIGLQWVATEGPEHQPEYVNVGDGNPGFSIGQRYIRETGERPSWYAPAGIDQGPPVQAGEHAKNTHVLYVVPCTEPVPPPFVNPAANTIAVRGEKQWQTWAQSMNDQLDENTDNANTRIPYQSQ